MNNLTLFRTDFEDKNIFNEILCGLCGHAHRLIDIASVEEIELQGIDSVLIDGDDIIEV